MSAYLRVSGSIPAFLVGMAASVAAELSIGLLLYESRGFVPALTLILAFQLGSLAVGLWVVPKRDALGAAESHRRRWLQGLVAFTAGGVASASWSLLRGLSGGALSRGLGLAFLTGLPLYACGALLGGIAAGREGGTTRRGVAAPALAGAAAGAVLTGVVLVQWVVPTASYLLCVLLLSAGALLHGRIIAEEGETKVEERLDSPYGEVRVETLVVGTPARHYERRLVENGRLRGGEDARGRPLRRWELVIPELLQSLSVAVTALDRSADMELPGNRGEEVTGETGNGPFARVLILGGGAFTLPRLLLARKDGPRVDVTERNGVVLSAAEAHFGAPLSDPRLRVALHDPARAMTDEKGAYQAIVLSAEDLAPTDPVPQLGEDQLSALRGRLVRGGVVVVGGIPADRSEGSPMEALLVAASNVFESVAVYGPSWLRPGPSRPAEPPAMVLVMGEAASLPDALDGMGLVARRSGAVGLASQGDGPEPSTVSMPPEGSGTAV